MGKKEFLILLGVSLALATMIGAIFALGGKPFMHHFLLSIGAFWVAAGGSVLFTGRM